jgi:hydroxypyruvate isomerase
MKSRSLSRRAFIAGTAGVAGSAALPGRLRAEKEELPEVERPGRTPNSRFAVNVEMWFRGPFEQRIVEAAELGYSTIEFWPYQGRDIGRIAKLLREREMSVSQFTAWGFGKELNRPDAAADRFVKAIEESCDVADSLPGCELFTVVIGDDIEGVSKEAMHAAAIEKIKKVVDLVEKRKKTIIIEPMNPYNHPAHCLYGSKDTIALCEAVGSERVKINWDLFHMQRYEGNLIDNLRKGKEWIGYFQLADSPDRNEPGTGEVDYTNVLRAIREIGYTLPIGLELSPREGNTLRAAQRVHRADTW